MKKNRERKIIRAETMGYCMGVRRAVQIVNDMLDSGKHTTIHTMGPLIHNRHVLEKLVRALFLERNIELVDATCPRVLRSQRIVKEHSDQGFHIVIVGDKDHGEVRGIAGYAGNYRVIKDEKEAQSLKLPAKTMVIGQTTLRRDEYARICDILKEKNPHIKICRSICPATEKRQEALRELAEKVDAILVVGGRDSSNTKHLYRTASKLINAAWHIEEASEIPLEINNYDRIGITAGASTPDWIIDEVERRLLEMIEEEQRLNMRGNNGNS